MTTWDETTPAGSSLISGGDDSIRDLKIAIRERANREHFWPSTGDAATHGEHRLKSDVHASRGSPTAAGRVYISTDKRIASFDLGAEWLGLSITSGTFASRGSPSVEGRIYVATDSKLVSVDLGSEWLELDTTPNPVGAVQLFAGADAPAGWILCQGQGISRTVYSALFAVIGTTYGVGDGSTSFNLPNLKGRVPVGLDITQTEFDVLGEVGGEKTHILTSAEMPSHSHTAMIAATSFGYDSGGSVYDAGYSNPTNSVGSDVAHNNLQPFMAMHYIIRSGVIGSAAAFPIVGSLSLTGKTPTIS